MLQETQARRLLEVRRQSRRLAAEQREAFKAARIKEASEARRIERARREHERREHIACLLLQHFKEQEQFGEAQRNAHDACQIERSASVQQQRQEKVRHAQKRQRFNQALRALRKADACEKRLVLRCIESRRLEKEKSRARAIKYRQTAMETQRRSGKDRSQEMQLERERREPCIDFGRTRMHQQLGIVPRAQRHEEEKENAHTAAQRECNRQEAIQKVVSEERVVAQSRARARGEVALLRERAIVRRQLHEMRLEKLQREEMKKKQREIVMRREPLTHRAQIGANCAPAAESVRDVLLQAESPKQFMHQPDTQRTSPCSPHFKRREPAAAEVCCKDAAIQVEVDQDEVATAKLRRSPSSRKERQKGETQNTSVQCKLDATSKKAVQLTPGSQSSPKARPGRRCRDRMQRTQLPSQTKIPQKSPATSPVPKKLPHHADKQLVHKKPPVPQSRRKALPDGRNISESPVARNSFERIRPPAKKTGTNRVKNPVTQVMDHRTETRQEEEGAWQSEDYEDALSQALSMDTDLFMLKYFNSFTTEVSDDSVTTDDLRLDELSTMLASSTSNALPEEERTSIQELESLQDSTPVISSSQSNAESIFSPSLNFSFISDDCGVDICLTPSASGSSGGEARVSRRSRFSDVLDGLDKLSGESLTLLSNLSTIVTANTNASISSEPPELKDPVPDARSSAYREPMPSQLLSITQTPCSSPVDSELLLLETILEGSEKSDISTISSSVSSDALETASRMTFSQIDDVRSLEYP